MLRLFFLLSFAIINSHIAFASDRVAIYSISIPGLHQEDGQGDYDKIINDGIAQVGQVNFSLLPPKRAFAAFQKCSNCCISPANLNPDFYDFKQDIHIIASKPMAVAKIYVFSGPGASITYSSLHELVGLRVGIRRGMPYGKRFEEFNLNTSEASDLLKNISKLKLGRVDVIVAYMPDVYEAFEQLDMKPLPHQPDNPIAIHNDSLVCRGVSKDFISLFNSTLP